MRSIEDLSPCTRETTTETNEIHLDPNRILERVRGIITQLTPKPTRETNRITEISQFNKAHTTVAWL